MRQFGYDNLYRNVEELWYDSVADADADANRQNTMTFTYDTAGQMLTADDDSAAYVYDYDDLGRLLSVTHTIDGLTPQVILAAQYDEAGRRTRLSADVGGTDDFLTDYVYDNLGRVDTIAQQGQVGGNAVAEKSLDFAYDAAGQPEELLRYANLAGTQLVARTDWSFDGAGRLTDLTHKKDTTIFADYDWLYDVAGRISDFDFTSLVGQSGTADYTHDETDQLTDAAYNYQTDEDYDYDENGNRTNNGYTVGSNNRLTSDGTYAYLYDAEGNRTHRFVDADTSGDLSTGDTDITEYEWDHRNRLTKLTHYAIEGGPADQIVEYAYDFGNRWVRKVLDTDGDGTAESSTVFVSDGNQIALQFDKTGTADAAAGDLSHRYLWGPAVDQILADEQVDSLGTPGDVLWPLTDHLGSVRDLASYDSGTDTTTIANHRTFDAFGNVTSETTPAVDHLFAFTGRALDEDTGLQNNLNRWYDANVGRWLSEDPIGFGGGDANLCRYVKNGPVNTSDPKGLGPVYPWMHEWGPWNPPARPPAYAFGHPPDPADFEDYASWQWASSQYASEVHKYAEEHGYDVHSLFRSHLIPIIRRGDAFFRERFLAEQRRRAEALKQLCQEACPPTLGPALRGQPRKDVLVAAEEL